MGQGSGLLKKSQVNTRLTFYTVLMLMLLSPIMKPARAETDEHGFRFIGWTQLSPVKSQSSDGSTIYEARIDGAWPSGTHWIPSWNVATQPDQRVWVDLEIQFEHDIRKTYQFGCWHSEAQERGQEGTRTSINHQDDPYGVVYTDTLILRQSALSARLRLRVEGDRSAAEVVSLLGLCVGKPAVGANEVAVKAPASAVMLEVPARCQFDYIGGKVWCSPTSVTMIMQYWADQMQRAQWSHTVPQVAAGIFDPGWPGTGNWSFNVAYAGAHTGLRSWVCRLRSMESLFSLIEKGIPVAISVSYDLLKGKAVKGNNDGHLIVMTGWDQEGRILVNDPARCPQVNTSYPVEAFVRAWNASHRTVYLILPDQIELPEGLLEIEWLQLKQ
jgi:uncharacterized protein YvpB